MRAVLKIGITAVAVWVAVELVPGLDFTGSVWALLGIAVVIALAGMIAKPLLVLFSLPLVIGTLGLFLLVINAIVFQIAIAVSGALDLGLSSTGFFWATFLGALVVSLVRWALDALLVRE